MRRWRAKTNSSCCRSASTADCMSGYCSLQASGLAVLRARPMDLAEGGGGGGVEIEGAEPALPLRPELRLHAALDEGRPHGRRLALQLLQLGGIFRRDEVGDGGEQLRHLHDRPFQAAERLGQHRRVGGIARIAPEEPRSRHARRHPAHIGADPGIAGSARGEAVRFAVGIGHDVRSLALKPESLRYVVRRRTLGRCGVRPSGCRRRQKAACARSGP